MGPALDLPRADDARRARRAVGGLPAGRRARRPPPRGRVMARPGSHTVTSPPLRTGPVHLMEQIRVARQKTTLNAAGAGRVFSPRIHSGADLYACAIRAQPLVGSGHGRWLSSSCFRFPVFPGVFLRRSRQLIAPRCAGQCPLAEGEGKLRWQAATQQTSSSLP